MGERGYWDGFGAPSNVDWCEPNYLHSTYVAEWWNTWSSFAIVVLAVVVLLRARRLPWKAKPRFAAAAFAVAVVGLGSALFHGTLLRVSQAADELPMIYTGLTFVYALAARRSSVRRGVASALAGYGVAFTIAYVAFAEWFHFFVVSYALIVAYIVVRTGALSLRGDVDRRRWFLVAVLAYVGGFAVLWVPEHLVLACDHPLQALQLHALFHLTSAVGSCAWVEWALVDWRLESAR